MYQNDLCRKLLSFSSTPTYRASNESDIPNTWSKNEQFALFDLQHQCELELMEGLPKSSIFKEMGDRIMNIENTADPLYTTKKRILRYIKLKDESTRDRDISKFIRDKYHRISTKILRELPQQDIDEALRQLNESDIDEARELNESPKEPYDTTLEHLDSDDTADEQSKLYEELTNISPNVLKNWFRVRRRRQPTEPKMNKPYTLEENQYILSITQNVTLPNDQVAWKNINWKEYFTRFPHREGKQKSIQFQYYNLIKKIKMLKVPSV